MNEFLFELGVEELPPFDIYDLADQFTGLFKGFLEENKIRYEKLDLYFAPRRIAVYVKGVSDYQETWEKEITGPPANVCFDAQGNPTKALLGFLQGKGLTIEDIFVEESKKGKYVKAKVKEGGRSSKELLVEFLPQVLVKIKLKKSMKWNGDFRFLRPIRWILALWNEEKLNLNFAGLSASNVTYGHRSLGGRKIEVEKPSEYLEKLRENLVYANQKERREAILNKINELCSKFELTWETDEELLDEVVNLVEYPGVVMGEFPERYLDLPEPVVVTAMKQHQRYFSVRGKDGKLANKFITAIDNLETYAGEITPNHAKVLRARLEDAEFYMHEDLKVPLEERVDQLKKVVFREEVGTVYDKVKRIEVLTEYLSQFLTGVRAHLLKEAVYLCKTDLTTLMIKDGKEFTKLEGIIGMEYALRQGKDKELARIIYDHILPRYLGDELPETIEGALISISDKIDNLFAFIKSGIEISASFDPFGMRRMIYGVFEVIKAKKIRFNFREFALRASQMLDVKTEKFEEFMDWVWKRLENYLEEKEGIRYDVVDSVIEAKTYDIWDIMERAKVLNRFYLENPGEFEEVVVGQKRANNILQGVGNLPPVSEELFEKEEERNLHAALLDTLPKVKDALSKENYQEALMHLRHLKPFIDKFFDDVFVMVDDEKIRLNRLSLLYELRECFRLYGDFSKIVV